MLIIRIVICADHRRAQAPARLLVGHNTEQSELLVLDAASGALLGVVTDVGNVGGVAVDALGRLLVAAGTGVRCVELPG